ncbi:MAG: c-type cytochrome domain-containing protein, partial [Pirellulaceae bacterium]
MISWPHKSSICSLLIGLSWLLAASSLPAADPVPYLTQVKPLLKKHCFACHGTLKQNSSLRLDAGHLILKGGESGPAVVPGKPADSPLLQRILETDADLKMPQQGIFLKPVEIELIKTWIEQGASFPANDLPEKNAGEHWAFNTPRRVSLPESRFPGWGKHPIDRLAGDRLFSANLVPSGQATPAKLLRRLYIDLTGLPPGREQLLAFLADPSDKHYRQL